MEKKVEEMTEEAIEKMKKEHEFSGFRTEKTMERAEQLEDAMGQADKDVSGETEVEKVDEKAVEDLKKKHEFSGYVVEKTMERAEEIVDALKEDK